MSCDWIDGILLFKSRADPAAGDIRCHRQKSRGAAFPIALGHVRCAKRQCHLFQPVQSGCQTGAADGVFSGRGDEGLERRATSTEQTTEQKILRLHAGRALEQGQHSGIAETLFDRPFLGVAGAAENLNGITGTVERHFSAQRLDDRQ